MPGDATDAYAADKLDPALIDGSGDPKRTKSQVHHSVELPPMYDGAAVAQTEWLDHDLEKPSDEDLTTLRRVSEKIPFKAYTVATVELMERLSFYGTTQVSLNRSCHLQSSFQSVRQKRRASAKTWLCGDKMLPTPPTKSQTTTTGSIRAPHIGVFTSFEVYCDVR